jgi:tRNA(fMet)-specific endonuclease VapC
MADFLLDTDAASRLLRADRATVNAMRRSGASSIAVSAVTRSELLYGARLRMDKPALLSAVHAFLARVTVHAWGREAADAHACIRAKAKQEGRSAGTFDLMIAAHARALDATLVTGDNAIRNLKIEGLKVVTWG